MGIEVVQIPCLQDNYGYLLHDHDSGLTATVDTPEVDAIMSTLEQNHWKLTHVLNTHHHWDHIGGNLQLKEMTGCTIVGAKIDQDRIPGIDICVSDGQLFLFGHHEIVITETPGHTSGHITYYLSDQNLAFVGDTLFSMGCGRLFEGTAEQMWQSLQKLLQLPEQTLIYCAHEYTEDNGNFALSIDSENEQLLDRMSEVRALRKAGRPTIPTSLAIEKQTNPFLRPDDMEIRTCLGMLSESDELVFAQIRKLKDNF
ncbi:MAG: hydroxyacylglutathione hydrolase [Gammaproteobacteria bacterium]